MEIGETRTWKRISRIHIPPIRIWQQTAVFTVTVNSISVPQTPVLSDEYVAAGIEDCESVEDYREFIHDILMNSRRPALKTIR